MNMEARGVNGQVELHRDKVVIKRKGLLGLMSQGLKGDKEIAIRHISAIQMKKAGLMFNGYIQFTMGGGVENRGGLFAATNDENTVRNR